MSVSTIDIQQQVRELLEPSVERLGYDLVAVEWLGGAQGRILRVSIDAPGGISAEDCGLVSEILSPLLDESDPIEGRYNLEVSSPGIERPVQRRQDFERFVGFRIKLRLIEGPPRRRYTGELVGLDGDEVVVRVDGAEHSIPLETIERANLVLTLDEYQSLAPAQADANAGRAEPGGETRHDDQ